MQPIRRTHPLRGAALTESEGIADRLIASIQSDDLATSIDLHPSPTDTDRMGKSMMDHPALESQSGAWRRRYAAQFDRIQGELGRVGGIADIQYVGVLKIAGLILDEDQSEFIGSTYLEVRIGDDRYVLEISPTKKSQTRGPQHTRNDAASKVLPRRQLPTETDVVGGEPLIVRGSLVSLLRK